MEPGAALWLHGGVDRILPPLLDFTSLLIFPFLGVMALLKRRGWVYLVAMSVVWTFAGAVALLLDWTFGVPRARLEHGWLVGVALAAGFLAVAWLKEQRKVSRWLKLGTAALTLIVFLRALQQFFLHYG